MHAASRCEERVDVEVRAGSGHCVSASQPALLQPHWTGVACSLGRSQYRWITVERTTAMYIIPTRRASLIRTCAKLWESVSTAATCSRSAGRGTSLLQLAYKAHKYQVENGVQKYIYHRPAHGAGVERHQPPYLHWRLHRVQKNMCFSEEPGYSIPRMAADSTGATPSSRHEVRLPHEPRALIQQSGAG